MSDVKIVIKGTQYSDDHQPMVTEWFTEGHFYEEASFICYEYEENDAFGGGGVATKLTLKKNGAVILDRNGPSFSTKMIFDEGLVHESLYVTKFGSFDLRIKTSRIFSQIEANGKGMLLLDYQLSLGHQSETTNKLEIQIT